MLKADGYGHGATDAGRAAVAGGARRLCVATLDEGLALREALPDVPVVMLSPLQPGQERDVDGLEVTVSTPGTHDRLREVWRALRRPRQGRHRDGALGVCRRRCAGGRPLAGGGRDAGPDAGRRVLPPGDCRRGGRGVPRRCSSSASPRWPRRFRRHRGTWRTRQRPSGAVGAPRRGALRDRAVRRLAVRGRPGGRRTAAGAAGHEPGLRAQDAAAGRVVGLRPAAGRARGRRGSPSCRWATPTATRGCCRGAPTS